MTPLWLAIGLLYIWQMWKDRADPTGPTRPPFLMGDPVSIFHLARSNAHPLRAVRRAAVEEARRQIALLRALDLSDAGEYGPSTCR
jgi:hypothetical protein